MKLLFFLAGTLAMIFVMDRTGHTLKTPATPHGIVGLELARNSTEVRTILNAWQGSTDKPDNIRMARINTYWDFLFIFFYAGFLHLLCRSFAQKFSESRVLSRMAAFGSGIILLAAILDILENGGMLLSLSGTVNDWVAAFTSGCSAVKWGIVLGVLLTVVVLLVAWPLRRLGNKKGA